MRFHTIPLLLFSLTAFAGPAIQFCADRPQKVAGGSSGVAVWTSMDGDWSLPFDFETSDNARAILTQLGIRSDPLYSTFLMLH